MMKNVQTTKLYITSNGWLVKFMSCNNLLLQRKSTIAQKDLSYVTGKLVGNVVHIQRPTMKGNYLPNCVIAMDGQMW